LAKNYHCEVTGVDSEAKLEMMKSIGFDHVLDYKMVNFTKTGQQYDLILDCKTMKPALSYLSALNPNGIYVTIGGNISNLIRVLFWGMLIPIFSSKKLQILSLKPNEGLEEIGNLIISKQLKSQIDGPYAFEEIPRLIQYFGDGLHKGKIVVKT
jgi:NADPH:quinone reductase-like Zn-dependent oxidoreductase